MRRDAGPAQRRLREHSVGSCPQESPRGIPRECQAEWMPAYEKELLVEVLAEADSDDFQPS